ncbi:MAG: phytanoyl-CoA dioxygenase family protein [Alphaproteobacteria bacterium]|nr:phytanoyl-CoA dioxygenase family protein [Alphaproteobacteria bacterium]MBL6936248.1 phytanoyl-CoA dioxygenase family protein [Alphaproteobacteria bacterium]MBL7098701.1 phytanoyl-CoA dioxygenase family protein [Alphaproteobacteria bacterium]
MSELDNLKIYGETTVGWCAATPPNETTDEDGRMVVPDVASGRVDPRAPGSRRYDDPGVKALRETFRGKNGMIGLEICEPHEVERATRIFFRDGFVVVNNLLDPDQLERWRDASARVLRMILEIKGEGGRKYITESGRLPHRYSYGTASASRELLHDPVWASMVDLPTTTPILKSIFGGNDYFLRGAGGDLCLPGAIEYQGLHADTRDDFKITPERLEQAGRVGIRPDKVPGTDELTASTVGLILERTPPHVTINFLMSDFTWENGPVRQIPGTHGRVPHPPKLPEEPEWMRLSTLVGAKAGAGVFRDNRAWHGATPNLSKEIRAMPNVEYHAPWVDPSRYWKSMPHEIWETLSPHAQHISRYVKEAPGVWPAGAGVMHPLANKRKEAKEMA